MSDGLRVYVVLMCGVHVCMYVCICQIHKYCIQAVVLRKSWPLSQSQWSFVQSYKDNDQNEQNEVKGSQITSVLSPYYIIL